MPMLDMVKAWFSKSPEVAETVEVKAGISEHLIRHDLNRCTEKAGQLTEYAAGDFHDRYYAMKIARDEAYIRDTFISGAVDRYRDGVVGGRCPRIKIRSVKINSPGGDGIELTGDEPKEASRSINLWAKHVGLCGSLKTSIQSMLVDGECGIQITDNAKMAQYGGVPLGLAEIPSDWIHDPAVDFNTDRASLASGGIRYDADLNAIAYPILTKEPNEAGIDDKRFIPESRFCHLWQKKRPGQKRGFTHLLAALPLTTYYRRYLQATVAQAEQAANQAAVITGDCKFDEGQGAFSSYSDNPQDLWKDLYFKAREIPKGGQMMMLPEGCKIQPFELGNHHPAFKEFDACIHMLVCWCIGVPYVWFDIGKVSFAASQTNQQPWSLVQESARDRLECQVLNKVCQRWIEIWVQQKLGTSSSQQIEVELDYFWHDAEPVQREKHAKALIYEMAAGITPLNASPRYDIEDSVNALVDHGGKTEEEARAFICQNIATHSVTAQAIAAPAVTEAPEEAETEPAAEAE